jgi:hypothetical protein
MQDSKFWRVVAVVFCGGVLYVGHGLHSGGRDGIPSLVNTARAGGVGVDRLPGQLDEKSYSRLYTANEDGTHLLVWKLSLVGDAPEYMYTIFAVPERAGGGRPAAQTKLPVGPTERIGTKKGDPTPPSENFVPRP